MGKVWIVCVNRYVNLWEWLILALPNVLESCGWEKNYIGWKICWKFIVPEHISLHRLKRYRLYFSTFLTFWNLYSLVYVLLVFTSFGLSCVELWLYCNFRFINSYTLHKIECTHSIICAQWWILSLFTCFAIHTFFSSRKIFSLLFTRRMPRKTCESIHCQTVWYANCFFHFHTLVEISDMWLFPHTDYVLYSISTLTLEKNHIHIRTNVWMTKHLNITIQTFCDQQVCKPTWSKERKQKTKKYAPRQFYVSTV